MADILLFSENEHRMSLDGSKGEEKPTHDDARERMEQAVAH